MTNREVIPFEHKYYYKCGVYQIRNTETGKVYVGSSKGLGRRKVQHFSDLRCGRHASPKLQCSFDKHGEDKFVFEIIELCKEEERISKEQYWIDLLEVATAKGYNICSEADKPEPCRGGDNAMAVSVVYLETRQVFRAMQEAAEHMGIERDTIGRCCLRSNHTSLYGHWMYYEDYIKEPEENIQKYLKTHINRKAVVCLETEDVYKGITEAGNKLGIRRGNVLNCCERRRRTVTDGKGNEYHFMYLEEYEKATPEEIDEYINGTWIRQIIKLGTMEVFKDKKECAKKCGIDRKSVYNHCNFKVKNPQFMYYDEYIKLPKEEIEKLIIRDLKGKKPPVSVKCVESNEIFKSISSASKKYGLSKSSIVNCCKGKQQTAGGFHWQYT